MEKDQVLIRVKVIKNIDDAGFQKDEIVYMTEKEVKYYENYVENLDKTSANDMITRYATAFKTSNPITWENVKNQEEDYE